MNNTFFECPLLRTLNTLFLAGIFTTVLGLMSGIFVNADLIHLTCKGYQCGKRLRTEYNYFGSHLQCFVELFEAFFLPFEWIWMFPSFFENFGR
jgi:hypothetical protein